MDKAITLITIFFIVIFSLLSLYTFYDQVILHVSVITPQLVTASFAIVGSCVLVVINTITQVQSYYKLLPIKAGTGQKVAEETSRVFLEKQKALRASIEAVTNSRQKYENMLKKYIDDRETTLIPSRLPRDSVINEKQQQTMLVSEISPVDSPPENEYDIKIQGLKTEYINILKDIGINTISNLSQQNPEVLYRKIYNWSYLQNKHQERLPSKGMIKRWIRIANEKCAYSR